MRTDDSEYLVSIARTVASGFQKLPDAVAAMLGGSTAQGLADRMSDIDMSVYYSSLPALEELKRVWSLLVPGNEPRFIGDEKSGGVLMFGQWPGGIEVQIAHVSTERLALDIEPILRAEVVITPYQKLLTGLQECIPLFGEEFIEGWRTRLNEFPESLALAMVEQYSNWFPVWSAQTAFGNRDILPWIHEQLVDGVFQVLGVLAGLNSVYFTRFQLKRTGRLIDKFAIKPANLADRINTVFSSPPQIAAEALRSLVAETVELVEQHMQQANLTNAKMALSREWKQWQPVDLNVPI